RAARLSLMGRLDRRSLRRGVGDKLTQPLAPASCEDPISDYDRLVKSSTMSLQNASVSPCGVLQDMYAGSLMLAALVRNCACSEPTTLPWASYSSTGALPATPAWPTARRMGGNPDAVTVNGAFTAHVFPGSA